MTLTHTHLIGSSATWENSAYPEPVIANDTIVPLATVVPIDTGQDINFVIGFEASFRSSVRVTSPVFFFVENVIRICIQKSWDIYRPLAQPKDPSNKPLVLCWDLTLIRKCTNNHKWYHRPPASAQKSQVRENCSACLWEFSNVWPKMVKSWPRHRCIWYSN